MGLSAPQVGAMRRVAVIEVDRGASSPAVYANPEILARSTPGLIEESCLSVPGVVGLVWRATKVKVRACDQLGRTFERELDGMHAVCLQHEIDHLDGKLFIDRLWLVKRLLVRSRLEARARGAKAAATGVAGIA
jgi:peptide deformylase